MDYCIDRHIRAGGGDKALMYYKDKVISYREMQAGINKIANALRELGIEKNDRVMLRSANCPEIYASYFACWRLGALPVLTHHLLRAEEIAFRANDSEAKAMIVSSETFEDVKKARSRFETVKEIIAFGRNEEGCIPFEELIAGQPAEIENTETYRDDWMRIIYSSGTTGNPKGIINTIGDMVALQESYCKYILDLRSNDVIGGHPAFAFAFGFSLLLCPGFMGSSVSIVEKFDPKLMFETIQA
ncbi:MAG: AMP-binding protein, partial [Syntrophobacteraceae bacterium]